jgi:hypothetical protein
MWEFFNSYRYYNEKRQSFLFKSNAYNNFTSFKVIYLVRFVTGTFLLNIITNINKKQFKPEQMTQKNAEKQTIYGRRSSKKGKNFKNFPLKPASVSFFWFCRLSILLCSKKDSIIWKKSRFTARKLNQSWNQ